RFLEVVRGLGGEPFAADHLGQAEDEVHVVINQQGVRHHLSVRSPRDRSRLRGAALCVFGRGGLGARSKPLSRAGRACAASAWGAGIRPTRRTRSAGNAARDHWTNVEVTTYRRRVGGGSTESSTRG